MSGETEVPDVEIAEAPTTVQTNEYDTLIAQAPPKPAGNEYDAVVVDMAKERGQRVRATLLGAQGAQPEAAAKAARLSQKTGLPADMVERNLPKVEGDQKLNDYDALLAKSPRLTNWLLQDQANAKVAGSEGDFSKLGLIEEGVNELRRGLLGQQANSGFAGWKAAAGKLKQLEDAIGRRDRGEYLTPWDRAMIDQEGTIRQTMKDAIIEYGGQFYDKQTEAAEIPLRPVVVEMQKAGKAGDWGGVFSALKQDPLGAIYSISMQSAVMLPWQIGAYMAAGPMGAFGVSFLSEYMGAVTDALEEGGVNIQDPTQVTQAFNDPALMDKVERQAAIKAATIGAVDAASLRMARVPLGVGKGAVTRAATNIPAQIALQGTMGAAGEAAGSALAGLKVDPFNVVAEGLGEMGGAPLEVVTTRWAHAVKQDATREQWEKFQALPPVEQEAVGTVMAIDKLIGRATDTKLAKIAPEKMQEFIKSVSDADQTVYVPAEVVATYMQDMTGLEAQGLADRLGITDQLSRAARTGEDIAISLAMYVTGAGEAHAAWRNDIRTEVDGFSVKQAQEWEKAKAAETKAAIARFEEQIAAGIGEVDGKTRVYQHVLEQLKNSAQFTNDVASQHAALYAARYEARAARNPDQFADAWDAFQRAGTGKGVTIRAELPESIRALGPDRLDVMLDSIRSGSDPVKRPRKITVPEQGYVIPEGFKPDDKLLDTARRLARGWNPEKSLGAPQSLVDFVRKAGGLNIASSEAGDLRAADLGRIPGLLQKRGKKKGRAVDEMAQAALDMGYRFGAETKYGSGVDADAFLQALIDDASGSKKSFPDDERTEAWLAQQEYFDQYDRWLKDDVRWSPKGRSPMEVAWFLSQDEHTQRLMALAERVDNIGPEMKLEDVLLLDEELARVEQDTLDRLAADIEAGTIAEDEGDGTFLTADDWRKLHADLDRLVGGEIADGSGAREGDAGGAAAGSVDPAAGDVAQGGAAPQTAGDRRAAARAGLAKFQDDRQRLQDALQALGVDVGKMSNAEVRAALEKAAAGDGAVYEQAPPEVAAFQGQLLSQARAIVAGSALAGQFSIDDVYFVGSRASGRERPTSDYDFVVHFKTDLQGPAMAELWQRLSDHFDAIKTVDIEGVLRSVDIFVTDELYPGRRAISSDGTTFNQPAFHGSPHLFDRFSTDAIGTGEGAQAFGWGLYFAGKKEVAEYYRDALTSRTAMGNKIIQHDGKMLVRSDGKPLVVDDDWRDDLQTLVIEAVENGHTLKQEIAEQRRRVQDAGFLRRMLGGPYSETLLTFLERKGAALVDAPKGRLFEVDIPDDGSYLRWDKPVSQQSENIKAAIPHLIHQYGGDLPKLISANGQLRDGVSGEALYRALAKATGSPRSASDALRAMDVPGIQYLDGTSRRKGEGTFNYVIFDDSLVQVKSYEQSARGSIEFGDNGALIRLFEGRDLSTLAHESGHLFLAEMEFDVKALGGTERLREDWQTILDFVGSKDGFITREQHELFARAFETYLMEGKAPSEGLRRVFRSFKNWLIGIYRNLARLQAPISPEMRQVFDRLVATDEEIEGAKKVQGLNPIFPDAKSAEMSKAEFDAYTRNVSRVVEEAEQRVLEKVMASIRKERTKEVAAEKAKIRSEVKDEMMADPGNAALHFLRTGEVYAGSTPEVLKGRKLSQAALVAMLGQEGLKALPRGVYAAEGIEPDALAEIVGLGNGAELVERLMQIQAEQEAMRARGDNRSLINVRIAEETQRRLTESLGDPLNDGSIEAEAMAAVHTDKQAALMATELRVLARKAGRTGAIGMDDIKAWASQAIGEMSSYQAAQFAKYQRAERMAGQKVQRALVKGDFVAAFKAKQDQLLSFALYQEARKAAEDTESIRKLADRYASAETIKSMDQDALEQIHQLLEDFDFKKRSGKLLAERTTFNLWADAQRAAGFEVVEPPRLKGAGLQHYSSMTMDELRALGDSIRQIAHIGRWKQSMVDGEKKRQFQELVAEAVETAGKIPQRGVDLMRRGTTALQDRLGDVGHWFRSADAALLKLETIFEWLDGDKSGRGVFSRTVFRRMAEAQSKERDLQADLNKRLKAVFDKVPRDQVKRWQEQHVVLDLGAKLNKSQMIAVALNMGNASNMEKLLLGEGWGEVQVREMLDKHLTWEEWQFVQDTWDLINSLWPEVEAMERRINGVAPPKVEAVPVPTPFGTLAGGYYPMSYDKHGDIKADRIASKGAEGLFDPEYRRASTRAGATHKRVEGFNAKVFLSLSVIGQHLNEAAHDLAFREAVMDAYKFLSNDEVRVAIRSAIGAEYEAQIQPWLKNLANEWAIDRRGLDSVDKFLQVARTNTTMVGMGFRLSTMFSQLAGFSNSIQRIGSARMFDGMRAFYKDPAGMADFVRSRSGEMRHRANDLERDIRAAMQKNEGKSGVVSDVRRFAFRGIALLDAAVSLPTWMGAYNEGLKQGMTDADAVYYADKTVRDTQGAGAAKDLAAIQRGGEALKLFTMFYSYFNVFYNRQRGLVRDAREIENTRDAMDVVAQAFWLMIAPTLMAALLSGQGPDEDEEWGAWAARNVGFGIFSGVPYGRDIANAASNKIAGKGFGGAKLSPIQGIGEGVVHLGSDIVKIASGDDASKNAVKNTFNVGGLVTGLPTGQLGATSQYVWDVLVAGTENPRNLLEWMRGLTFGPEHKK